jgi:hypothetical protein
MKVDDQKKALCFWQLILNVFIVPLPILVRRALTGWGQADFSLVYLLNEPNFGLIHLAGQYL